MEQKIKRPVGRPRKNPQPSVKPVMGDGLKLAANKAKYGMDSAPVKTYNYPIKAPSIPQGVVPAGRKAPVLAMDANYQYAADAYPGGGFPGFAYLSSLATRAEYQAFARSMSVELTREWIKFNSTKEEESSDKIKAIESEFKRLNIRGVMQKAAEHDCYFGRAQIFLDIRGADRKTPLILDPRTVKQGSLQRVVPVEAIWTTPSAYNALDPSAPDFYKPSSWFMLGQEVHASRLMTVVTRPLPDILKPAYNFAGMSLSQLAEPYVDNWLRTRQSVSDLINNFSITALATAMDQVLVGDDDGTNLFARADLFTATRSNKGLMLLDKDREELLQINTPLSGLHELQAQSQEHMCLAKWTLIETRRGQVPINLLNSTDEVLTRQGWAPIEWVGETGSSSLFVQIHSGNSMLRVTDNHPIWLEDEGRFVPARDVLTSNKLRKSASWIYTDDGEFDGDPELITGIRDLVEDELESVYNLKVKEGYPAEFFANGVLVHNCSVSRMPAIILTGISPSGLNASSEGEIRVFYDWIAAQQEAFWREPLEVILKTVQLSLFGEIDPDIGFDFIPLFQMTAKEEADIRYLDMQTDAGYIDRSVLDPSEIRSRLAKSPCSGYQGLDIDSEIVNPNLEGPDPGLDDEEGAEDKSVSEAQRKAMQAAAHGEGNLGIPVEVAKEFVKKDAE